MGALNPQLYQPRLPVVTASAAPIPPFGVVRLVSSADGVWTVAAPAADGDPHVYLLGDKTLTGESGDRGDATFEPLGRAAYDAGGAAPAVNEEWGPAAGSFLLKKGNRGFRIAGEADGFSVVVARIPALTDDYPYPYGSYDAGGGGSAYSFDGWLRVTCDAASGNFTQDHVRYTVVNLMRGGRVYSSISMKVVEEDVVVVPTETKDVLTDVHVAVAVACVDGSITATPVVTKTIDCVRSVVCGPCNQSSAPPGAWYCVRVTSATPYGTGVGCSAVGSVMVLQISGTVGSTYAFSATGPDGGCLYESDVIAGPFATEGAATC